MSTQSINNINITNTCIKIDDFFTQEGVKFINNIDFDFDDCINYNKIKILNILKNSLEYSNNCNKILETINKILLK